MLCDAFGYILGNMTTTMIFSLTTHPEAIFIEFFFHWRESSLGIYDGRIKRFSASVLIFQPPKPASFRKCFLISHFHYFSVFFFLFMFIPINGLYFFFITVCQNNFETVLHYKVVLDQKKKTWTNQPTKAQGKTAPFFEHEIMLLFVIC